MEQFQLTKEQEEIAKDIRPGHMAIRGVAGSGKTSVGLKKLHYLAETRDLTKEKVLFVTFQNSLKGYLNYLLEEQFSNSTIDLENTIKVETVDSVVYQHYIAYKECNPKYADLSDRVDTNLAESIFREVLVEAFKEKQYPPIKEETLIEFYFKEVQFIITSRLVKEQQYLNLDRSSRVYEKEGKKITAVNEETRSFIYSLRTKYIHALLDAKCIDWPVMRMLALTQAQNAPLKKYTHIIIDECQDLDRVRLELILSLLETNDQASVTYLYDNDQSIFEDSWLGKGQSFKTIGANLEDRDYILNKNFRTTSEIQKAANDLLKEERGEEDSQILVNKSGIRPIYGHFQSLEEQLDYLSDVVKAHLESFNLKDILILSRKNKELTVIKEGLNERGVGCDVIKNSKSEYGRNQVRLMTMNAAKGLEASVVILANLNENSIPAGVHCKADSLREKKILYVAMTRATNHLYLSSCGEQSPLLSLIDETKLYLIKSTDRIRFAPELKRQNDWLIKGFSKLDAVNDDLNIFEKNYMKLSITESLRQVMDFQKVIEDLKHELLKAEDIICEGNVEYELYHGMIKNIDFLLEKHEDRVELLGSKHEALFKLCVKNVKERFTHFKIKQRKDIYKVMFIQEKNAIDPDKHFDDYTREVIALARVMEGLLSKILIQKGTVQINIWGVGLSKIMDQFGALGAEENQLMKQLEESRLRILRNTAGHKESIKANEFTRLYDDLFYEYRIFDKLNDYIEECSKEKI